MSRNRQQFVKLCKCGCGEPTLLQTQNSPTKGWTKGQPQKTLKGHSTADPPRSKAERFAGNYEVAPNGCWLWSGTVCLTGYGYIKGQRGKQWLAHRVSYELHAGPIPEGAHIDHVCHNADKTCVGGEACQHRRCVNPAHLEAVSQAENNRRAAARRRAA